MEIGSSIDKESFFDKKALLKFTESNKQGIKTSGERVKTEVLTRIKLTVRVVAGRITLTQSLIFLTCFFLYKQK